MICPIGLRWRREMKQAHKQASEENLRLKASNYYMFLSAMCSTNTSPHLYLNLFLLLICCGLLFFILRQSELCWEKGLGQQNFTVILDCCRGLALSCLLSQGLPSFPNSCRCSPCQDLTTTDQSLANSVFGSGQPCWTAAFANIAPSLSVFLSHSVILLLSLSPSS